MEFRINPAVAATFAPPVMEARRWTEGVTFPPDRPLLNVSQAAPVEPPPEGLRRALAEAALNDPSAHLYGPVLGNDDLRAQVAQDWSAAYGAPVAASEVAITQGCNMAFCATILTLAGQGDEVVLPAPWYFNHKMWLDMSGVTCVPLMAGADLLPDPEAARALITSRTRAITLVTPNNPGGVEYPASLVRAFYELAKERGIALIVDETYRDFDSRPGAPHDLFSDPDWRGSFVQLYSFSKAFRLTGHRVGAIVAGGAFMAQVEKVLDTLSISASQMGQIGALWGMRNLGQWLAGERQEILARRDAVVEGFRALPDWRLMGCGAYFAFAEVPQGLNSAQVAQRLVREAGLLMLPGTMFTPDGAAMGARTMRIAFANVDRKGIAEMCARLAAWKA